jgi:hypothetical protein
VDEYQDVDAVQYASAAAQPPPTATSVRSATRTAIYCSADVGYFLRFSQDFTTPGWSG